MSAENHRLYLLHAIAPLHIGSEEGSGGIDLPTLRERHTGYPIVPGSTVKGILREEAERRHGGPEAESVRGAFGPPSAQASDFRSGLVLTDALLLALPVRSLFGTFAWVSCPLVLERLNRDLDLAGHPPVPVPAVDGHGEGLVAAEKDGKADSDLPATRDGAEDGKVFLEELALEARPSPEVGAAAERLGPWIWPGRRQEDDLAKDKVAQARRFFRRRFLVVSNDAFGFFTRLALEIRARVQIDRDKGTVKVGPWAEEHLPAESLLAGLALGRATLVKKPRLQKPRNGRDEEPSNVRGSDPGTRWDPQRALGVLQGLAADGPVLRFGGHSTIGLGRARFLLADGGEVRKESHDER